MTEVPTTVSYSAGYTDEEGFWQEKGLIILISYALPVIVFVGITGNLITFVVLFTKQFRKSPSSLILGALTLSDSATLFFGLHLSYVGPSKGITYMEDGEAGCKARGFFMYFSNYASQAFLVILTVERAISVFFPLKCREICSRRRILLCIITAIVLLGLASMFPAIALQNYGNQCLVQEEYQPIWRKWVWFDSSLTLFVPFILIIIGNISIIAKLYTSRRKLSIERTGDKRTSSVTVMLIAVSACFLVLNTPKVAYFVGNFALDAWPSNELENLWNQTFFYYFVIVSAYANNAINFVMYCLTGSKFRKALKDLFARCVCLWKLSSATSKSSTSMKSTIHTDSKSKASNGNIGITKTQL